MLWTHIFILLLIYYPKKDLARSRTELGHRTKNKVTMWTQHRTASHSITLPCSITAWYSSTMTRTSSHAQTFIYKEIQIWVAIKTLYITWLGLQPSVGLYSYSNNAYLCLTFDYSLHLDNCVWATRPKMHLGLDADINTWLFTLPFITQRTLSALLNTLPKQEEVAACSSLPTLPTNRSQT